MKGVSNSTAATAGNGSEEPEAERFLDGAMEEEEHDLTARPWTCEEAEEAVPDLGSSIGSLRFCSRCRFRSRSAAALRPRRAHSRLERPGTCVATNAHGSDFEAAALRSVIPDMRCGRSHASRSSPPSAPSHASGGWSSQSDSRGRMGQPRSSRAR